MTGVLVVGLVLDVLLGSFVLVDVTSGGGVGLSAVAFVGGAAVFTTVGSTGLSAVASAGGAIGIAAGVAAGGAVTTTGAVGRVGGSAGLSAFFSVVEAGLSS